MDQLGTMEPDQLLQLLVGVVGCAVTMLALTVVYVFLARRSGRAAAVKAEAEALPAIAEAPVDDGVSGEGRLAGAAATPVALDVGARLAGTGRDAWQSPEVVPAAAAAVDQQREILRVVQDPTSLAGSTWIKIGGVRYARLSEVRDRTVGERILAATSWALRFSSGRVASDQGVVTLVLPPCDAVPVPAAIGVLVDEQEPGEVFRLLGDPGRNEFWVQVAGRRYRSLGEITDRMVGELVLNGISRLLQFSQGRIYANDGVRVLPVPRLSAAPVAVVAPPTARAAPEEEEAFLEQMRRHLQETAAQRGRRKKKGRGVTDSHAVGGPANRSFSLVDEIDGILQRKLKASPLARTDAQFVARPDGSVRIRVGSQYYDRPDEVPDAELRRIIEAAIAEW